MTPTTASVLFEVFVRPRRGLAHQHVGSVHAADPEQALRRARDLYTRHGAGVSLWVVPSAQITASSPGERDPYFAPARDKTFRPPAFHPLPEGVRNL